LVLLSAIREFSLPPKTVVAGPDLGKRGRPSKEEEPAIASGKNRADGMMATCSNRTDPLAGARANQPELGLNYLNI
jgi:hypothetical protein